ncbi:NOL1/NOP2/sun family putative RNA methylase [Anaerotaenia torta]
MRKLLGAEYEEYLACYTKPHYGGVRINTLKTSPEEFEDICPFELKRIPWIETGYYYDIQEQPAKHPFYYGGVYYIQEPSAMTPASLLPVEPGDRVLDICAAPGGKSTELGARLKGQGVLVSNDISNSRAKALLKNIELFGIRNALVLSEAPNRLAEYFEGYFDKILVDAPCSGEGMFRKSPAIIKNWEQYGVEYYNKLQKEIILFAARMLKPGGYMLYSTCTFSPEENEGTIAYLMEQCPEFHVVPALPGGRAASYEGFDRGRQEWLKELENPPQLAKDREQELAHGIRLWPHKIEGEGHFIILLHKDESDSVGWERAEAGRVTAPSERTGEKRAAVPLERIGGRAAELSDRTGNSRGQAGRQKQLTGSQKQLGSQGLLTEEAMDFIRNIKFPVREELLHVHEDRVYLLPEGLPNLKGLRILRQGLLLGEMKKQRFEPSQALACALTVEDYGRVLRWKAEDPNVIRYLKCEAIDVGRELEDGWYLVCVEKFPLGWLKAAKNSYKNKYLPGWRWV